MTAVFLLFLLFLSLASGDIIGRNVLRGFRAAWTACFLRALHYGDFVSARECHQGIRSTTRDIAMLQAMALPFRLVRWPFVWSYRRAIRIARV